MIRDLESNDQLLKTRKRIWSKLVFVVAVGLSGCTGERPQFHIRPGDAGSPSPTDATGLGDDGAVNGNVANGSLEPWGDPESVTPGSQVEDEGGGGSSESDADDGSNDSSDDPSKEPLELGTTCSNDEDCDSGFCVDGVCCDSGCAQTCARCDDPEALGTCTGTSYDSACELTRCDPDTECRTYEVNESQTNCASLGVCAVSAACTASNVPEATACQNGEGTCDGDGQCIVPGKKLLGEGCSEGDACGSSFCSASEETGAKICCDAACDGLCESCSADGHCTGVSVDDVRCPVVTCAEETACVSFPVPLMSGRCIAPRHCVDEGTHCMPKFEPEGTTCGQGLECSGDGTCLCANAGQELCGDACVDTDHDVKNCGNCGNVCPEGSDCTNGNCKTWGPVMQVTDGSALSAAVDAQGNVFVAYMGGNDRTSVYVRRKPMGGSWQGAQLVDAESTRGDFYTRPQVVADNSGNALITWGSADGYGYSRYRASSQTYAASAYIPTPSGMGAPLAAMAPSGNALAAWDNQVASSGTEVWLRGWDGSTGAWYPAQAVSRPSEGSACLGGIGASHDGNALVVYSENAQVYARSYDIESQAWIDAPSLLNEGYCFVSMAFDGSGTTVVASAGSENIYGSVRKGQGGWTTEALAPPGTFSSYRGHVSAFAGTGRDAIVAVEQNDEFTSIVAITWNVQTGSWQGVTPLLAGTASSEFKGVSMSLDLEGNGFVVSVEQATGNVVGRKRNGSIGDWDPAVPLGPLQGGAGSVATSPTVRTNASGNAVLVWAETTGEGNSTIWARTYE